MAETIFMLNLKIGLNEEQYLKLRNRAVSNMAESVEQEAEKLLKSVI